MKSWPPLQPPESHNLSAAQGWLGLGNPREAAAELERLPRRFQGHPDVLEARWQIEAQCEDWDQAVQTSRELLRADPSRPCGWLHQSYALRRASTGTLQHAMQALLPAADKFPEEPTIPYNLACYACQMQDLVAARLWLQRAEAVGGKKQVRSMALADPDLAPLWGELREAQDKTALLE